MIELIAGITTIEAQHYRSPSPQPAQDDADVRVSCTDVSRQLPAQHAVWLVAWSSSPRRALLGRCIKSVLELDRRDLKGRILSDLHTHIHDHGLMRRGSFDAILLKGVCSDVSGKLEILRQYGL